MDSEEVLGRQFASRPYKQLGEFLRKQRLAGGETLRAFCKRTGRDAGMVSLVEMGRLPPSEAEDEQKALAKAYGLREGSEALSAYWNFVEGAIRISRGELQGMELSQ
jgi:transcriptional regulator with XRE-family HTH domain